MADDIAPVTVVATPPATVTTTVIKRRSFKLLALNIVSGLASTLLAVLGYL